MSDRRSRPYGPIEITVCMRFLSIFIMFSVVEKRRSATGVVDLGVVDFDNDFCHMWSNDEWFGLIDMNTLKQSELTELGLFHRYFHHFVRNSLLSNRSGIPMCLLCSVLLPCI